MCTSTKLTPSSEDLFFQVVQGYEWSTCRRLCPPPQPSSREQSLSVWRRTTSFSPRCEQHSAQPLAPRALFWGGITDYFDCLRFCLVNVCQPNHYHAQTQELSLWLNVGNQNLMAYFAFQMYYRNVSYRERREILKINYIFQQGDMGWSPTALTLVENLSLKQNTCLKILPFI